MMAVWVSERLRLESEGDEGAGGRDGGVRVPLVAAMMNGIARFAMRDGVERCNALGRR